MASLSGKLGIMFTNGNNLKIITNDEHLRTVAAFNGLYLSV